MGGAFALLTCVAFITGVTGWRRLRAAASPPIVFHEAPAAPLATAPPSGETVVHVSGAVKAPGVYHLPSGSRGEDALRKAGGSLQDADLDAVNLARKLEDGEKLHIPRREAETNTPAPSNAKPSYASSPSHTSKPHASVNINTATAAALEGLPGVGPALAQRIVAFRQQSGGFRRSEDLLQVSGIGPKKFSKMKAYLSIE
jgi:competence protein ComEA